MCACVCVCVCVCVPVPVHVVGGCGTYKVGVVRTCGACMCAWEILNKLHHKQSGGQVVSLLTTMFVCQSMLLVGLYMNYAMCVGNDCGNLTYLHVCALSLHLPHIVQFSQLLYICMRQQFANILNPKYIS